MDIEQAKKIASEGLDGCTITEVEEYEDLYAVYFVNNEYLESRDFKDMAIGAGPRMIVKSTGELFVTGSAQSGASYAKAYEQSGSVYGKLIDSIIINKLPETIEKSKAILLVKNICEISLPEARLIINTVIQSGSTKINFEKNSQIKWTIKKLKENGFQVEQLWGVEC